MDAPDLTCYDIEYWRGLLELSTEDDGEPVFWLFLEFDTPMKKEVKSDPSPFSKENDELAEV